MPDDRRIATLLAFAQAFEVIALDDALDLFDLLMSEIFQKAEADGKKTRIRTIRDLDAAALQLHEACQLLLDDRIADMVVRRAIFACIPRECIVEASATIVALTRQPDDQYYPELVRRYQSVRRFLPTLLKTVPFHGTQAG